MTDAGGSLAAAWGQATSAWWALMAGSWTAVDAVVRTILEASYDEADITRVNEVEFDVPVGVDHAKLVCGDLVRIAPAPVPQPIKGGQSPVTPLVAAGPGSPARARLRVDAPEAVTGDYVARIMETAVDPPREVARVVVFVLGH